MAVIVGDCDGMRGSARYATAIFYPPLGHAGCSGGMIFESNSYLAGTQIMVVRRKYEVLSRCDGRWKKRARSRYETSGEFINECYHAVLVW